MKILRPRAASDSQQSVALTSELRSEPTVIWTVHQFGIRLASTKGNVLRISVEQCVEFASPTGACGTAPMSISTACSESPHVFPDLIDHESADGLSVIRSRFERLTQPTFVGTIFPDPESAEFDRGRTDVDRQVRGRAPLFKNNNPTMILRAANAAGVAPAIDC